MYTYMLRKDFDVVLDIHPFDHILQYASVQIGLIIDSQKSVGQFPALNR